MSFDKIGIYCEQTINLDEVYIKSIFDALNIKKIIEREVMAMDFNGEKFKEYYAELLAKKEQAVLMAMANKDQIVAEKVEAYKQEILAKIDAEIVAEAEAPFKHDIELCEKFLDDAVEEKQEENNEQVEVF